MADVMAIAERFFAQTSNRGHAHRETEESLLETIRSGLEAGRYNAGKFLDQIPGSHLRLLDVGCSWGPTLLGLAVSERVCEVTGVDVEAEALELAGALAASDWVGSLAGAKARFVASCVESMPFPDAVFDVILCNTVIEHVYDVEQALQEMIRVLRPGGILHLEAPNYLWPFECHLGVYMLPLGPKWLVKWMARRKRDVDPDFVDHLQFVHPFRIEKLLRRQGVPYRNIYLRKLEAILLAGDYTTICGLRRVIPVLTVLHRLRITRFLYALVRRFPFYPSLSYQITKP